VPVVLSRLANAVVRRTGHSVQVAMRRWLVLVVLTATVLCGGVIAQGRVHCGPSWAQPLRFIDRSDLCVGSR
jgi:hypothetical protein